MFKGKTRILLLLGSALFLGGMISLIFPYPFIFVDREGEYSKKNIEEITNSDPKSVIQYTYTISTERKVDMLRYLLSTNFSKNINNSFAIALLVQELMPENEGILKTLFSESCFINNGKEEQTIYTLIVFSSLAKHHVGQFLDFYEALIGGNASDRLSLHKVAYESFFLELLEIDPVYAYQMLTGETNELAGKILSEKLNQSIYVFQKNMSWLEELRGAIILKMGLSQPSIFFKELNQMQDSNILSKMLEVVLKNYSGRKGVMAIEAMRPFISEVQWSVILSDLMTTVDLTHRSGEELLDMLYATESKYADQWINVAIEKMAKENPTRALDVIETKFSGLNRERGIVSVLTVLIKTHSQEEIMPIIENLSEGMSKEVIKSYFFEHSYSSSPETAVEWMKKQKDNVFLKNVLERFYIREPEKASTLSIQILNDDVDTSTIRLVAEYFARRSQTRGLDVANELKESVRGEYLDFFYKQWNLRDSEAAEESRKKNPYLLRNSEN